MKKLIATFLIILVSSSNLYAQNKAIKGRVVENHDLKALGYVAIMINDKVQVGRTDLNGFFQIEYRIQ